MARELDTCQLAERSLIKRYRKELWNHFIAAIKRYQLIQSGDKIAVCISGGKDSWLLAMLMKHLQPFSEVPFELEFICMDPGYSPENRRQIEENAALLHIPLAIFETDVFSASEQAAGENPCYICARMRRGHLYAEAQRRGCNKIALGHHLNDVIETALMSMTYGAQLQGMVPRLRSTNFEGMELIRPLYLVHEEDIITWREENNLEFIHCACPLSGGVSSCDAGEGSKRACVKALIASLSAQDPDIAKSIFHSVENVHLDAIVGWRAASTHHNFLERYDEGWEESKG